MNESRGPGDRPPQAGVSIELTYARAEDVLRDRLRDAPRGVVARSDTQLRAGDLVNVRFSIASPSVSVSARGVVRWATPLARGSLAGLHLAGSGHRDDVKLDLIFGVRTAGTMEESRTAAQPLSVTMLQRNGVLRQVLQLALEKFAREKAGGAELLFETTADVPTFVASVSARRPDLAIIDCDGVEAQAAPLLEVVRAGEPRRRTPVILLSSLLAPSAADRYTVTMHKPVAMKALLDTADLLLRS